MTEQTRQSGMIAAAVLELRVIEALGKLHLCRGCRLGPNSTGIEEETSRQRSQTDDEN